MFKVTVVEWYIYYAVRRVVVYVHIYECQTVVDESNPDGQKQFGETLKEALSGLAKNTEGLQVKIPYLFISFLRINVNDWT